MAKRLFHHYPSRLRQARLGQTLHNLSEQERRNSRVEDRGLRALDRVAHTLICGGVGEIATDVGKTPSESVEDFGIKPLSGALDRLPGALHQLIYVPIVDRHADDRALQQAAGLEPVQRPECHHLGQIPGDSKNHAIDC